MKAFSGYVRVVYAPAASLVAYKTSADVVSKGVTLIVTVAAARTLSAADFGVLALAMTTGWLLGVASDSGLPMYLATRVAHASASGRNVQPLVDDVMRWRWSLGATAALAGFVVGTLLLPAHTWLAFTLIVGHQLAGAMLETLAHAYRGLGRTDIESTLTLLHRGLVALAALTVLAVRPSLLAVSVALLAPPLATLVVSHLVVRRVVRRAADSPAESAALDGRRFSRDVAPLGAAVLLSALYFRCDVYFLERLHGVESVGLYNAAFRIVDALRLFPAAALAVAYPALCRAADQHPLRALAATLTAAGTAVGLGVFTTAQPVLALVYGDAFAVAARPLRVLALSVPLFFLNYALTHQLIAWQRQRSYLGIAIAALAVNLAGNSLLIPEGGMAGAAWSTLITEAIVAAGCVRALRKR